MHHETTRKSPRYPGFDYSAPEAYFVTVCCHQSSSVFGRIRAGKMQLSKLGWIAHNRWLNVEQRYSNVFLDAHVIMPNHMHALLAILSLNVGEASLAPSAQAIKCSSLASVIGNYKAGVTREARRMHGWRGPLWQRSYHDHVLRESWEAEPIRAYIVNNPLAWHLDKENTERTGNDPFDMWLSEVVKKRDRI